MTKAEAKKILNDIERSSESDLAGALDYARTSGRANRQTGTALGAGAGALAGALSGNTPAQRIIRAALGGVLGGGAGFGVGSITGATARKRVYDEVKRRRDARISDLLSQLDEDESYKLQRELAQKGEGIQTESTDYGFFARGKGTYKKNDRLKIKRDEKGRPLLSLLFAGINSAVEEDGPGAARSPLSARFYNKNKHLFSDVQANSVWDDPIVADAYTDKIIAKIMANRKKTGKYPRIRIVGYSAGGRGIVNFLRKMRERDPQFRADEVIGIDPYQFPWEGIPKELRDPTNPVANRIVYSRLADNYTGSSQKSLAGKISDTISNTIVSVGGKKLRGLAANTVVENALPGISHTDAEPMYQSALKILSELDKKNKEAK